MLPPLSVPAPDFIGCAFALRIRALDKLPKEAMKRSSHSPSGDELLSSADSGVSEHLPPGPEALDDGHASKRARPASDSGGHMHCLPSVGSHGRHCDMCSSSPCQCRNPYPSTLHRAGFGPTSFPGAIPPAGQHMLSPMGGDEFGNVYAQPGHARDALWSWPGVSYSGSCSLPMSADKRPARPWAGQVAGSADDQIAKFHASAPGYGWASNAGLPTPSRTASGSLDAGLPSFDEAYRHHSVGTGTPEELLKLMGLPLPNAQDGAAAAEAAREGSGGKAPAALELESLDQLMRSEQTSRLLGERHTKFHDTSSAPAAAAPSGSQSTSAGAFIEIHSSRAGAAGEKSSRTLYGKSEKIDTNFHSTIRQVSAPRTRQAPTTLPVLRRMARLLAC